MVGTTCSYRTNEISLVYSLSGEYFVRIANDGNSGIPTTVWDSPSEITVAVTSTLVIVFLESRYRLYSTGIPFLLLSIHLAT